MYLHGITFSEHFLYSLAVKVVKHFFRTESKTFCLYLSFHLVAVRYLLVILSMAA